MGEILRIIVTNQIVAFIVVVGVVVLAHELGHFLAARLSGILVEEFSIGFGPTAFGFVRGGTEYKICWLPLGGYVRLYGAEIGREVPLERRHRAITTAALYKRVSVAIAGPLANALLTWIVLSGMSWSGIEKLPPVVSVMPTGAAAAAGVRDGDRVVAIDGVALRTWDELTEKIGNSPGVSLRLSLERSGELRKVNLTPVALDDESAVGEQVRVGRIGVTPYFQTPHFAISSDGLLGQIGLRSGDKIVAVDGKKTLHVHNVEQAVENWLNGTLRLPLHIEILRPKMFPQVKGGMLSSDFGAMDEREFILTGKEAWFASWKEGLEKTRTRFPSLLGAVSTDLMVVAQTVDDLPEGERGAASAWSKCGLTSGTALVGIGDYGPLRSRVQLNDWLERLERRLSQNAVVGQDLPPQAITMWGLNLRGALTEITCEIPLRVGRDHLNRPHAFLTFPFRFLTRGETLEPILVRSETPWAALKDGATYSWELSKGIFETVGKLVSGRIPMANLGGPIEIARVAGSAAKIGFGAFISMIAFISINVGLINLLPIPILDGGTLLLLGVEAAYGKSLPVKVQEAVQKVGIMFILGLIFLVIYNDILRRISN